MSTQPSSALVVASAALAALVATVMTLAVSSHRMHRGQGWWLAAQWLLVAGLALQLVPGEQVLVVLVGEWLLLQWPILIAIGLRRFNAREPLPGSGAHDGVVLGFATAVALAEAAAEGHGTGWHGAMALSHGYAAGLLLCYPPTRARPLLKFLAVMLAAGAVAHAGAVVLPAFGEAMPAAGTSAVASALLGTGMGFVTLLLSHERTVAELRDSRRRLRHLANIDTLTQVPNRRHFLELARRALQRRRDGDGAVLMFDIDHFKQINDDLGHVGGDRALRIVSRSVQEVLRADDVAGRHGGDEFVLLLPGVGLRDAITVAARIAQHAQRMARVEEVPSLSMSFGVVNLRRDESIDDAIRRADQALYEAKRQGRGRAVGADGDVQHPVFVESRRLGLV